MTEIVSAVCDRCKLPIVGEGFTLRLEGQLARAETLDVALCPTCTRSLNRWLERSGRKRGVDPSEALDEFPSPKRSRRREAKLSRTLYSDQLDRANSRIRARGMYFIASIAVLALAGFAFVASRLSRH
jgi:hypothetical protein